MTQIGIVFARARNGVIGKDGLLPWHLPEDLAHFKRVTLGSPVIMGRKTWESLPPRFRPLPGRDNIVVTRQADWQSPGAKRVGSLEEAIALCKGSERVWVIGGADIFAQALAFAHTAEVTELDADYEGNVFAPAFDAGWAETAREAHRTAEGLNYSFVSYRREARG